MTECAICYDKFSQENKSIKFEWCNCQILYCKSCLDIWLKDNNNCPICKITKPSLKEFIIKNIVKFNQFVWFCIFLDIPIKLLQSFILYIIIFYYFVSIINYICFRLFNNESITFPPFNIKLFVLLCYVLWSPHIDLLFISKTMIFTLMHSIMLYIFFDDKFIQSL